MFLTSERTNDCQVAVLGMNTVGPSLIHDLSRRLNCISRYERYIANAEDRPEVQEFWRDIKSRQQWNIQQLYWQLIQRQTQSSF